MEAAAAVHCCKGRVGYRFWSREPDTLVRPFGFKKYMFLKLFMLSLGWAVTALTVSEVGLAPRVPEQQCAIRQ